MQPTELSTTNYEHASMVEQNKLEKTKQVNPPIIHVKNVSSRYGPTSSMNLVYMLAIKNIN
jgi:hypothetical protein